MSLTGMSAFGLRFPDVAARETRVVTSLEPQEGLPAGNYGFLELYRDDPACDCRRVLLQSAGRTPAQQGPRRHQLRLGERRLLHAVAAWRSHGSARNQAGIA